MVLNSRKTPRRAIGLGPLPMVKVFTHQSQTGSGEHGSCDFRKIRHCYARYSGSSENIYYEFYSISPLLMRHRFRGTRTASEIFSKLNEGLRQLRNPRERGLRSLRKIFGRLRSPSERGLRSLSEKFGRLRSPSERRLRSSSEKFGRLRKGLKGPSVRAPCF